MNTDTDIRRPALSGIESAAFGVIALAGLASILLAGTPLFDSGPQTGHRSSPYLSNTGAPPADIASTPKSSRHS